MLRGGWGGLHSGRHLLARVNHTARDGPVARVLALDGDHLQLSRLWVEARHDRVGGVVGPPLAQQPSASHAGAPARVDREALWVEADGPLIAQSLG